MKSYNWHNTDSSLFRTEDWVKHDEAHAIIKEAYEAIVKSCWDEDSLLHKSYCSHCHEWMEDKKHDKDCIVNKAEQWLKENR